MQEEVRQERRIRQIPKNRPDFLDVSQHEKTTNKNIPENTLINVIQEFLMVLR